MKTVVIISVIVLAYFVFWYVSIQEGQNIDLKNLSNINLSCAEICQSANFSKSRCGSSGGFSRNQEPECTPEEVRVEESSDCNNMSVRYESWGACCCGEKKL